MRVVGVTGTNGKTTTAYLLASMLDAAGLKAGLLGTVTYRLGGEEREASRTTPEAPDVQQLLAEMIRQGCKSAVMEVSSHALALKRVDGMRFAAGIFTNLTRDHLDFHEDMENYFLAKRRLFEMLPRRRARRHQPRRSARRRRSSTCAAKPVTFAIAAAADVTPGPLEITLERPHVRDPHAARHRRVQSRLVGRPNVYNILAAAATAVALDLPLEAIAAACARCPACRAASRSSRRRTTTSRSSSTTRTPTTRCATCSRRRARWRRERLITVFGCGGDRDRTKRPLMGMVAARLSDVVVITSDNPRSEEPQRIIDEIKRGIPAAGQSSGRARGHPDRRRSPRGDRTRGRRWPSRATSC